MPDFPIGNYAFFGVGEPAACGAGGVTVPFAVVACCNAFPRPQRDDAERGEVATQPDADTPLSRDVCAQERLCWTITARRGSKPTLGRVFTAPKAVNFQIDHRAAFFAFGL